MVIFCVRLEKITVEAILNALEEKLDDLNVNLSKITKSLSEFERQLRNSNERVANFIERRGLDAQSERIDIIQQGLAEGFGDRVIQLKLDLASRQELNDYNSELEQSINEARKRLESGALAEGYQLVQQSAGDNNLTLNTETIKRLLTEERDESQKDALAELLFIRENKTKLNQYREQLAQNLQSNRNALIDFNRTNADYFFRINTLIKEAKLEAERLMSELFYTDIKNQLRSASAPGSNTFVNGIIDNIQALIDQASQIAQKVFGDSAAQLGFESETRTAQTEMQDFIRAMLPKKNCSLR